MGLLILIHSSSHKRTNYRADLSFCSFKFYPIEMYKCVLTAASSCKSTGGVLPNHDVKTHLHRLKSLSLPLEAYKSNHAGKQQATVPPLTAVKDLNVYIH